MKNNYRSYFILNLRNLFLFKSSLIDLYRYICICNEFNILILVLKMIV